MQKEEMEEEISTRRRGVLLSQRTRDIELGRGRAGGAGGQMKVRRM